MSARNIDPIDADDLGPAYDHEWDAIIKGPSLSQRGTEEINALLDERFPDHDGDRDRRVLGWVYLSAGVALVAVAVIGYVKIALDMLP